MKVTVKQLVRDDSFQAERLLIDGKEVMSVCDLWECPDALNPSKWRGENRLGKCINKLIELKL
jgi:hypothetical protein